MGGGIADHGSWRWVFIVMFPMCLFGLVATPWLLTLRPQQATTAEKLARVDWVGGLLFMLSTALFLVAICWAGNQYAWNSAATIVPLVVGAVGIGASIVWERFAKEPMLRKSLFWSPGSIAGYICGLIQGCLVSRSQPQVPSRPSRQNTFKHETGLGSALMEPSVFKC